MQKILYHCDKCSKLVHEIHEAAPNQFGESFRGVACSGSVHVTVGTFPAEREEQMVPVGRTDDERLTLCDECVDSMSARDLCEFSDQRRASRRAKIERMLSGFGHEGAESDLVGRIPSCPTCSSTNVGKHPEAAS